MELFIPYIIAIGAVIFLMTGWFLVQKFWTAAFSDIRNEEDALAGRSECGSCGCGGTTCNRKEKENIKN